MKSDPLDELNGIRNELLIRITLQNLILLLAVLTFAIVGCVSVFQSIQRPMIVFLHACVSLALAAQWCHHSLWMPQPFFLE